MGRFDSREAKRNLAGVPKSSRRLSLAAVLFLALAPVAQHAAAQPLGSTLNKSGATVTGVTFRVWAPNAAAVSVAGDFNNWSASAHPMIQGEGGIWSATVSTARPQQLYKYVIAPTGGAAALWRKDPRAREVRTLSDGTQAAVIYDPGAFVWEDASFTPPFPNDIVMYEMHIGTFYDPRPSDGEPATFDDAIQKLDYLAALGINMIALMPVNEFNGRHSWGYNPTALFAIEEAYGGPEGLKRFVNEAHKRGMAVQVDVVHNHYGDMMAPGASDLENFDGGNPYFYNTQDDATRPGISRTRWGPRPRYADPQVRAFIKDNIKMLLDEYKIWALRWDSPRNITSYDANPGADVGDPDTGIPEALAMMQEIHLEISNPSRPHAIRYYSIAEDADSPGGYSGHWEIAFHDVIFPRLMGDPLPAPFAGRLAYPDLNRRNTTNIGYRLENKQQPGFRVIFSENHDKCGDLNKETDGARLAQDFDPLNPTSLQARKKSMLAAALTLTSAGTPMLFMGQEKLAAGFFDAYVQLDWLRTAGHPEVVRFHRDMIRMRRNLDSKTLALTYTSLPTVDDLSGVTKINLLNEQEGWITYERRTGASSESIIVAVNFSTTTRTVGVDFPAGGPWYVFLNSDSKLYGEDFSAIGPVHGGRIETSGANNYASFQVAPLSTVIFGKAQPTVFSADATANGIDDGWEILFGAQDATADLDNDGFSNLVEFQNGTDPTVPDRAALPGSFNDWNIVSQTMRWDPLRLVWRHVARFVEPGLSECKAYAGAWAPGGNHVFEVVAPGTFETIWSPSTNAYTSTRLDADVDFNGMADAWEAFHFYPATSVSATADPDGDGFSNLQEFQRGSDPTEADYPAMAVVGGVNGWNWGASNMRYAGHGVWTLALPFLQPPSDPKFKFGTGPTQDDDNWGVPTPLKPDGYKSGTDFTWPANVSGWQLVRFNEKTLANSISAIAGTTDSDADGMPNVWERYFGFNLFTADAGADADGDDVLNGFEYARLSNPQLTDRSPVMHMPNNGLWAENDPRTRMVWNRDIARWEFVWFAPDAASYEFKFTAGTYSAGTWGWAGAGALGQTTKWASGNIKETIAARSHYLVRFEEVSGTYQFLSLPHTDADGDGLPDEWERFHGFNPLVADANGDPDGDAVTNLFEYERGSNPVIADRQSKMHMSRPGLSNEEDPRNAMVWNRTTGRWEVVLFMPRAASLSFKFFVGTYGAGTWAWGASPTPGQGIKWGSNDIVENISGRGQYLVRFEEVSGNYELLPLGASSLDSDGDGLPDAWESFHGFDPSLAADSLFDADNDGITNLGEYLRGGQPRVADHFSAMRFVGSLNGWNFNTHMLRWNPRLLQWDLLLPAAGPLTGQNGKFAAGTSWDEPDWGDNQGDGIGDRDNGINIVYSVPTNTPYLYFRFDEITLDYSAGPLAMTDADGDGLSDAWAGYHGVSAASANPDGDPFTNIQEFLRGTNPTVADRYNSDHEVIRVASSLTGWNLAVAPQMGLVGDHLWQGDIVISSPSGAEFKFAAGPAWSNPNWGAGNVANVAAISVRNISLPQLGAGTYRFTFNDETLAYTVTRLPNTFSDRYPQTAAGETVRGMPALVEYLFGGTATQPPDPPNLPQHEITGGKLRLSFVTRTDDSNLTYVVQTTTDLVNGPWVAEGIIKLDDIVVGEGLLRRTHEVSAEGPKRFLRVLAGYP